MQSGSSEFRIESHKIVQNKCEYWIVGFASFAFKSAYTYKRTPLLLQYGSAIGSVDIRSYNALKKKISGALIARARRTTTMKTATVKFTSIVMQTAKLHITEPLNQRIHFLNDTNKTQKKTKSSSR